MWNLEGPYTLLEFDETLVVVRQGRDADLDVRYVDGLPTAEHVPTNFPIVATWQPVSGKEMLLLAEAFRDTNVARVWQSHRQPHDGPTLETGDVISRLRVPWQVITVQNWGDYSECMVKQVDAGQLAQSVFDAVMDPLTGITKGPLIYPLAPGVVLPEDPVPVPPAPVPEPDPTAPVVVPPAEDATTP